MSQQKLQKILDQIKTPLLLGVSIDSFYVFAQQEVLQEDKDKIPLTVDGFDVKLTTEQNIYDYEQGKNFYRKALNKNQRFI